MTPREFLNKENYTAEVVTKDGKPFIAYNDVMKLMAQYHEKLKQLELTAVVQAKPEVCECGETPLKVSHLFIEGKYRCKCGRAIAN